MSDQRLQPGPWVKTPAWRGGAFLLGFAFLLIIVAVADKNRQGQPGG